MFIYCKIPFMWYFGKGYREGKQTSGCQGLRWERVVDCKVATQGNFLG